MEKPRIIEHAQKLVDYTVFDVKWLPCSAKFISVGSKPKGTGVLQVYELDKSVINLVLETEKDISIKCCTFGSSSLRNRHIAVGDFCGKLQILDIERLDVPIYSVQAHSDIINSIDAVGGIQVNCGGPEIATGSKDGSVKIWDPRQSSDPVVDICPQSFSGVDINRDCWAVAFGDSFNNEERSICAGYDNGDIKLFDLRKLAVIWETTLSNGVCSIEFDRKDVKKNKLVVTTLEGGLYCYDMRTFNFEKGFACVTEKNAARSVGKNGVVSGPKSTVWTVKHLPQNRDIFLTCGGTGSLRLWNYHYPEKRSVQDTNNLDHGVPGKLEMLYATAISTQPIHCFDWSCDIKGLGLAGSFDQTIRVLLTTRLKFY